MKTLRANHILLTIFLLLAFASCRRDVVPDNIVDTATLTQFLTEAYIVQSYDHIVVAENRDSLGHLTDGAYDSLYSKYGITQEQYDSSWTYYLNHPNLLVDIYDRVVANLNSFAERKTAGHTAADNNSQQSSNHITP